ncbi:hypothetical protein VTK26DRAFT_8235 [Humicola hyalothermophila]
MSHDPGPSSAARLRPPRPDADEDLETREMHGRTEETNHGDNSNHESPSTRQERRREGLAKKLELISHLQRSLDMIVFVYICTLYYMECSFTRFLLRLIPHYSFLTPKDGLLLPAEHPHIYTIFVPSMLCMLAHTLFALPEAGEATRGYLHGGVLVDFVGQKPPTTKLAFLFFDVVILAAQCLMLAVHQERERLKKAVSPSLQVFSPNAVRAAQVEAAAEATNQDLDAEERGVLRDETDGVGGSAGLTSETASSGGEERVAPATDEQGGDTYSSASASVDMLDIIRSGNAVLGNFHVIHAVRTVGNGAQHAAAYSLRTLGYNATLAAIAAERRRRLMRAQQG